MIKMDAVAHHFDANETLFLKRQLEHIEKTVYEFKQRELRYRMYIPVNSSYNPGATSITYRMLRLVGMFKVVANYAADLPRADAYMEESTQKVKTIAGSIGYNTQEIRSAQMAGVPLETYKAAALRRAAREKENSIAWTGDAQSGILGLLNNPNIPELAAGNGAAGTSEWSTKTADEIILDVSLAISKIRTQSNGIHEANTVLMPRGQYDLIQGLPRSTYSDLTVLEFLKRTYPGVEFGVLETELDLAFTAGTEDGLIVYEKDREVLEMAIPLELKLYPIQAKNLEFTIPAEARNGGVIVRYPLALLFFTGI